MAYCEFNLENRVVVNGLIYDKDSDGVLCLICGPRCGISADIETGDKFADLVRGKLNSISLNNFRM